MTSAAPPPPPPTSDCPTGFTPSYADISPYPTTSGPATTIRIASGVIGTFPLPTTNPGKNSGTMWITDNVVSPNGGLQIDVMISKCKGYIPANPAAELAPELQICYYHSGNGAFNEIKWAGKNSFNYQPITLNNAGFCPAFEGSGQYYFNFRFTYQACNYGTCGEVFTWYDSYF